MIKKRLLLIPAALALLAQNATAPAPPGESGKTPATPSAETVPAAPAGPATTVQPKPVEQATPMAERVAPIAILNKQNGLTRDIRMRHGQAVRLGGVIIRLRACEATPAWEKPPLIGDRKRTRLNSSH